MSSEIKNTGPFKSKTVISDQVKDKGSDPFVVKKALQSKIFLDKNGFPKDHTQKNPRS